jgi:putative membrane protein
MDPKLLFWTGALANLGVIVASGMLGVRAIRRGDVALHRTCMLAATGLVVLFLASYLAKLVFLGREDRSAWTGLDYAVLYVHELCVAAMLVAGGVALLRAWRFRGDLAPGPSLPATPLAGGPAHRRAGRIAGLGGLLAFVTAAGVLAGMFARAGA